MFQPSTVPSLRLVNQTSRKSGSVWSSTAKPWFWLVITAFAKTSKHGWFYSSVTITKLIGFAQEKALKFGSPKQIPKIEFFFLCPRNIRSNGTRYGFWISGSIGKKSPSIVYGRGTIDIPRTTNNAEHHAEENFKMLFFFPVSMRAIVIPQNSSGSKTETSFTETSATRFVWLGSGISEGDSDSGTICPNTPCSRSFVSARGLPSQHGNSFFRKPIGVISPRMMKNCSEAFPTTTPRTWISEDSNEKNPHCDRGSSGEIP